MKNCLQRTFDQEQEFTIGNSPSERIRWSRMQKGLLIKTLASKVGINPATLSNIERKTVSSLEMITLHKLAIALEQPIIWFLGCFENMPEATFFEKLEKVRCYHGHTKIEMAKVIGVHVRTIFGWKCKEY